MQHTRVEVLPDPVADQAKALLELARRLSQELRPRRGRPCEGDLDGALDRDFGFDSLGRVELFLRIERTFGASLPEHLLASAETLRDLLTALQSAPGALEAGLPAQIEHRAPEHPRAAPHTARTLLEVVDWHVQAHGDRPHVHLDAGGALQTLSYASLLQGAQVVAAGLAERGLQPGQTVAIMLPTGFAYLHTFFGVLLRGAVPVPLYPPVRPSQIEEHLRRQAGILRNAQARWLVSTKDVQRLSPLLTSLVDGLKRVVSIDELRVGGAFTSREARAGEVALLQYTSGSTGDPKGVVLTHANLLANLRAMGQAAEVTATDVMVSWLPLYHDMGLIGAWLGSLYYGCPLVLMSPLRFLARPARWLWAIAAHRGTISAAPNFAYELCVSKISDEEIRGLDLGSWRMALNGAEAVSAATVRRFCERFAPYGFRAEAMAPVYGLAECSVGLAFPPPGRGPRIGRIARNVFVGSGLAQPADASDALALQVVACGRPLPDHEIRIVDLAGREVPERHEGKLQFRGPSATRGYFRNPAETARLFDGEWLQTGDLGYIAEGDVYVTGRSKDIIIRAGRHFHPQEIEDAVGQIEGLRKGCVAVFGSTDPVLGTERIVVLAETRESQSDRRERLGERVAATVTDLLGAPPDDVVMTPPGTVLKTSSGKIRRAACRQAYDQGQLGRGARAVRWQLARLAWSGALARVGRIGRALFATAYAGYAWLLFCAVVPPIWLLVLLLPGFERRWAATRDGARWLLRLSGTSLRVEGEASLQAEGVGVVVANHASYLDGIVLAAALPAAVRLVVKAELARSWLMRLPLNRLQVHYVERADTARSIADARGARELLRAGRPLLFFPEGTLTRVPGLRAFHMGAFIAAAEAGATLVPAVITGTRSMLRGGSWFLRKGAVHVRFGPKLTPAGSDFAAALQLRDEARAFMLAHCAEPDLADEEVAAKPT